MSEVTLCGLTVFVATEATLCGLTVFVAIEATFCGLTAFVAFFIILALRVLRFVQSSREAFQAQSG